MEAYTDSAPYFAAREYVGCFTVNDVRKRLGQSPLLTPPLEHEAHIIEQFAKAGIDYLEAPISVDSAEHYLPGCICEDFHKDCDRHPQNVSQTYASYAPTFQKLKHAAMAGCWFCSTVYGAIKASPSWDREEPTTFSRAKRLNVFTHTPKGRPQQTIITLFSVQDPLIELYVSYGHQSRCRSIPMSTELPESNPLSSLTDFAAQSVYECRTLHNCKRSRTPMPTRLLEIFTIDGKYKLKVVESRQTGLIAPYVALSHCWGKTRQATTTASNLEEMKSNIPWSELSQNFRDAIATTHLLGYQYLWIDGLCILQGDKVDFEIESGRMSTVFANCDLMLSGDRARDGDAGLFTNANLSTKSWEPLVSKETQHGIRARYQKLHKISGTELGMYFNDFEEDRVYPLNRRAWCLQERLMASRILHFGVDELHWECMDERHCQCKVFGRHGKQFRTWKMEFEQLQSISCSVEQKCDLWQNICSQYSERLLTNWGDRLPAISGLVKHFIIDGSAQTKSSRPSGVSRDQLSLFTEVNLGDYLAGLWSKALMKGICWHADYRPGRRISPYVAPSWSWASVEGKVYWDVQPATQIEIRNATCTRSGLDDTGSVCDGLLDLTAQMISLKMFIANVRRPDGQWISCEHITGCDPVTGQDSYMGAYRPDTKSTVSCDYDFVSYDKSGISETDMRLIEKDVYGILLSASLVLCLEPCAKDNTFSRIGIIGSELDERILEKTRFFKNAQRKHIHIV